MSQQIRFEGYEKLRSEPITEDIIGDMIKKKGPYAAFEEYRQGINQILVGPRTIADFHGCQSCYYYQETQDMVSFFFLFFFFELVRFIKYITEVEDL